MPIHVNLKGVSHPSLYHFGLLCAANNTLRDAGGGRIIYQLNWFWYSFSVTLSLSFTPMRFVDFIIQKTDIFHSFYWWCIFNCEIYPVCVNVKLLGRMNSFFLCVASSMPFHSYCNVWWHNFWSQERSLLFMQNTHSHTDTFYENRAIWAICLSYKLIWFHCETLNCESK